MKSLPETNEETSGSRGVAGLGAKLEPIPVPVATATIARKGSILPCDNAFVRIGLHTRTHTQLRLRLRLHFRLRPMLWEAVQQKAYGNRSTHNSSTTHGPGPSPAEREAGAPEQQEAEPPPLACLVPAAAKLIRAGRAGIRRFPIRGARWLSDSPLD